MQTLNDAGFERSTADNAEVLGPQGRAYKAGAGQIILPDAKDKSPAVQEYVAKFGAGIMGISIEVGDLARARTAAEAGAHTRFAKVDSSRIFLAPPAFTHGLWIEMTERSQLH